MNPVDLRKKLQTEVDWKRAFQAILVGAAVAFVTSLCDGIVLMLQGYGNNAAGGIITAIVAFKKFI